MDVICVLCVSLGSSTVQLHESPGSRRACACSEAGFSNQNDDRFGGVYYRRVALCCAFFVDKENIHKEMFPVYGGKRLSRKTVHNWVANVSLADDEVVETTVKRLLCCGLRRTDKAMGHAYQCWWRMCREIHVLSRFEYHLFCVLCPFVTYLLTVLRILAQSL
jgi:hypothetical protein